MKENCTRLTTRTWLSAIQTERLEWQTEEIRRRAKEFGSWEAACFVTLARTFGMGVNGELMEQWKPMGKGGNRNPHPAFSSTDAKGRLVPTAEGEVTFSVDGPARIIAVDNGNHSSDDLFDGNRKQLYEGFAMAIVRSNREAGKVKITAQCNGLKSVSKTVVTK